MGAEWAEAKQRIQEMAKEARIALEQRNEVIRGKTAAELRANALEDERDALQKRIDGIAETLGDTTTDAVQRVSRALFLLGGHDTHSLQKRIDAARDRVRFVADSDDRDRLAAILDGRELESKDSAPGRKPKP